MHANRYFTTTSPLKRKGKNTHEKKQEHVVCYYYKGEIAIQNNCLSLSLQDIPYAFWQLLLFFTTPLKLWLRVFLLALSLETIQDLFKEKS